MDKKEFESVMLDDNFQYFYEFATSFNVDTGENVYHGCKFCDYTTRKVSNMVDIYRLDKQICNHVWKSHKSEAEKKAMLIKSLEIASQEGQMRFF